MNQLYPIIRRIRRPLLPPDEPASEVRHLTPALSPIEAERVGVNTVTKSDQPAGLSQPLVDPRESVKSTSSLEEPQ